MVTDYADSEKSFAVYVGQDGCFCKIWWAEYANGILFRSHLLMLRSWFFSRISSQNVERSCACFLIAFTFTTQKFYLNAKIDLLENTNIEFVTIGISWFTYIK